MMTSLPSCLEQRSCRILRGVAVLEQRCGNPLEALFLLRNYLQEVDEFNMQVLRQLAMLHRDRQQWAQAGTCFRRLLKADPTNSEIAKELQVCIAMAMPMIGWFGKRCMDSWSGRPRHSGLAVETTAAWQYEALLDECVGKM
eukprot:Skav211319  [mRNA]  locus=scaffold3888:11606:14570:+ [translate_table: standard]